MNKYFLGEDAARFSVVSFNTDATTRVPWSYNATVINAGIDQMSASGKTSISDGFEAARQLFANGSRVNATKIVLLLTDGEQTVDAATGKTLTQTAIDAAALVKGDNVTVFAWGFGTNISITTLQKIASGSSNAILEQNLSKLTSYLGVLGNAVCTGSLSLQAPGPPPSLPMPPSPPPMPPPMPLWRPMLATGAAWARTAAVWAAPGKACARGSARGTTATQHARRIWRRMASMSVRL